MSVTAARTTANRPTPSFAPSLRPVEVVTTRAQRRARPKIAYGMVAAAGLVAIFLAQLVLSIVLSDGAYKISALLGEKRDFARLEESLTERLEVVGSTQNLASSASSLGMIDSDSAAFLRLSDGELIGAAASTAIGSNFNPDLDLIPNALLADAGIAPIVPLESSTSTTVGTAVPAGSTGLFVNSPTTDSAATSGAPAPTTTTVSVASNTGQLPSPQTR